MLTAYDSTPPKKAANLSINADLLSNAKALQINLSATRERALVTALLEKQREQWLAENQAQIQAYNQQVKSQGVFSDGLASRICGRSFHLRFHVEHVGLPAARRANQGRTFE